MASAARIVGFAHLLRTRSPHSPPAARRRAAMATAAHAREAKPYAAREIAACAPESQVRHGASNCGSCPEKPGSARREQLRRMPRKARPYAAREIAACAPGEPGPAWREQLRPASRKARPRAARATMARKRFGTRSRNGVETPKPVATSTAAAQPLISRQFATPRTAFRPKPRHRESPNRDERSSASSYLAAGTTSMLTAASQQAAMLRILNVEASTVQATQRANSLAAMPFLAEVG